MLYSTFLSILLNINLAYWWQCSTILSWVVRTCGQVKILKGVFSHQLRAQQLQVQLCVHQRVPGCGVSSSTIKKKVEIEIQCGPSMTSWVHPQPFIFSWFIPSIKGYGSTQDVIDGQYWTFVQRHLSWSWDPSNQFWNYESYLFLICSYTIKHYF